MDESQKYSLVQAVPKSFYSRDLYRDVALRWKGYSMIYLLALLSLYSLPLTLYYVEAIGRDLEEKSPPIIRQIPDVTITAGRASVSVPEPYFVYANDQSAVFMIIDTTGKTSSLQGTGARILLTRSQMMIRIGPESVHTVDLANVDDMTIDRRTLFDWIDSFRETLPYVLYPLFLILSLSYRVFHVAAMSVIGVAFNKSLSAGLSLKAIIRVSVTAMTPSLVIETMLTLFRIHVVGWWLVGVVLSLGYLALGIKANTDGTGRRLS